ncbi:uncharacterized protein LOC131025525 [Salvia miltiorrhiza]|uniref:uncharacterized protein LOC131025525 n=1 Tax=Salvia miltiorrhiza TaxID=226208 RepID=UPI0025AC6E25|nr:uncharacterized protein LOC131025525 [Salvia miltiorrhiza]
MDLEILGRKRSIVGEGGEILIWGNRVGGGDFTLKGSNGMKHGWWAKVIDVGGRGADCTEDGWTWRASPDGKYTTKSAYAVIKLRRSECSNPSADAPLVASVWQILAPNKAVVSAWRLLRNRLPSSDNLRKRNINLGNEELECKQCYSHYESISHLFTMCSKTQKVWNEIQNWIGIQTARPSSPAAHWESFSHYSKKKKVGKLLKSIWVGCCWLLWKKRNEKRFEGKEWESKSLVMELKARLWSWNKNFGILNNDMEFTLWGSNDLISRIMSPHPELAPV